ncbi:MAG: hypothetical protein ACFFKA_14800 [Candidatus Thorarchaeota archaeon]
MEIIINLNPSELLIITIIKKSLFNKKLEYHFKLFSINDLCRQFSKIALFAMYDGHLEDLLFNSQQYKSKYEESVVEHV